MKVQSIRTNIFNKSENLPLFINNNLKDNFNKQSVLVVTSKLLSLSEGLTVKASSINKLSLIKRECDYYLCEGLLGHHITIKNNLIMPTAGVDNSNSKDGDLLLLPKNIHELTKKLHNELSHYFKFTNWGLIICDSKTTLLRRGVTGTSLSYYGFQGLLDLRGQKDIFGNELRVTTQNRVDALAAAAVFEMGESNEQTPLAIISDVNLNFTTKPSHHEIYLDIEDDLYSPLYRDKIQH